MTNLSTSANDAVNNLPEKTAAGTYVSTTTEQTIALGQILGKLLQAGDVLVLTGDLGAGKTQLTKGIAAGMGVKDDVTSPTFTIEMVYEGTAKIRACTMRLSLMAQLSSSGESNLRSKLAREPLMCTFLGCLRKSWDPTTLSRAVRFALSHKMLVEKKSFKRCNFSFKER